MISEWLSNELLTNNYNIVNAVTYRNPLSTFREYIYWVSYIKNPEIFISIIESTDSVSIKSIDTRTGLLIDTRYIFEITKDNFIKEMNKLIKY